MGELGLGLIARGSLLRWSLYFRGDFMTISMGI